MYLLKTYCRKLIPRIVFVCILSIAATSAELFLPWAFTYMVNEVLPQNSINLLFFWGGLMVCMALMAFGLSLFGAHLTMQMTTNLAKKLREDLYAHSSTLDCDQVDRFGVASLSSRMTTDISSLEMFYSKSLTKGIKTPSLFLGSIIAAMIMDWKLSLIMLAILPLVGGLVYFTTTWSYRRFKETRQANDRLVKSVRETVMGIRVIKALSKFSFEKEKFDAANRAFQKKNIEAERIHVIGSPSMRMFINLGMLATLILGASWVNNGYSDAASLVAFTAYFTTMLNSLMGIAQLFTMFSRAAASTSRIEEVLKTTPRTNTPSQSISHTECRIEFRSVSFSYDGENPVLQDVSFTIKKGETLGIIGMTGAGKSTLIYLLLRLYKPSNGEIFINNKPLESYDAEDLYPLFGVVLQSDFLLQGTVSDNISFGRKVNEEQIQSALNCAQAHFVSRMPQGIHSEINIRGHNVSGGEKQRLLLSRALVDNPDILVLDDASSALDYQTDAKLRIALASRFDNTTKVLISQRVASLLHADKILVLEGGKITTQGTHDELLIRSSLYREISEFQLGDAKLYQGVE